MVGTDIEREAVGGARVKGEIGMVLDDEGVSEGDGFCNEKKKLVPRQTERYFG